MNSSDQAQHGGLQSHVVHEVWSELLMQRGSFKMVVRLAKGSALPLTNGT